MAEYGKYRALVGRFSLIVLIMLANVARADCRLALALALDVSGSVDAEEYRLQMDGLAHALQRPEIRQLLLATAGPPVEILVYEWSGPEEPRLVLGWSRLDSPTAIEKVARKLRATQRQKRTPTTDIAAAMRAGAAFLGQKPNCWRHVLDVSGDGQSNTGPHPKTVSFGRTPRMITVNALVIGTDRKNNGDQGQHRIGALSAYFQKYILRGPDSFVETAHGFDEYEMAMTRKLLKEMSSIVLSAAPPKRNAPRQHNQ